MRIWVFQVVITILVFGIIGALKADESSFLFSKTEKLEIEKKYKGKIWYSCISGQGSHLNGQQYVGNGVLIIKERKLIRVVIKNSAKKGKFKRISRIHLTTRLLDKFTNNPEQLKIVHEHKSPIAPKKITLEINKDSNTGKYYHYGTNGAAGVIGDRDVYISEIFLNECKSDYFSAKVPGASSLGSSLFPIH